MPCNASQNSEYVRLILTASFIVHFTNGQFHNEHPTTAAVNHHTYSSPAYQAMSEGIKARDGLTSCATCCCTHSALSLRIKTFSSSRCWMMNGSDSFKRLTILITAGSLFYACPMHRMRRANRKRMGEDGSSVMAVECAGREKEARTM